MTNITHAGTGSVSRGVAGFLEPVFRPVADVVAYVRRYNEYAQAEARLRSMSDHDLDDIGLTRGEIHARVWQDFDHR